MVILDNTNPKPNKEEIETNILNLKILSKIKEHDKLSTNDKIIKIDSPSIFQGMTRWINSEGRGVTLERLKEIIDDTLDITEKLLDSEKIKKDYNSKDLEENNVVIAEGIQTLLRYVGVENSYEKVKELTRNNTNHISSSTLKEFIKTLDLEDCYVKKIEGLTAKNYTGKITLL